MLLCKEAIYINQLFGSLNGNSISYIKGFHQGRLTVKNYNQVYEDIIKIASHLKDLGIQQSDKVGIAKNTNEYAFIILDLSLLYIKAIPVHISDEENIEDNTLISQLDITYCFYGATHKLKSEKKNWNSITIIEQGIASNLNKKITTNTFKDNDIFTYKRTSGTTGAPKYLMATTKSIGHLAFNLQKMFSFNSNDTMFFFLSQNIFLQRCLLYIAIISKSNIVITRFIYAFALLAKEQPTIVIGPSFFFDKLKEKITDKKLTNELKESFHNILGNNIRVLWTGSSKSKLDTLHFFNDLGYPIYEGYGMSEFGMIAKNYPNNNMIGSVGPIFPDVEIKFDKDNQILVKSVFIPSKKYLNGKSFIDKDGFLHTGDIGYLKNGRLFISGRIKNIIVLANGKKIDPSIIKTKIMQIPKVNDIMLFGNDKPYLTALIYINTHTHTNSIQTKIEEINKELSAHYKIFKYDFIDAETHQDSSLSPRNIIESFYN